MLTLIKKTRTQEEMPRRMPTLDLRTLTEEELFKVNLATIRESDSHCRWPKDVLERFLSAEV
ncbi:MAG TPA: hypothetical protein VJ124_12975 [Pyrinomonadaceae bacterium]|nr:hypothetical protein [Pyrinomonadaceae bacterium]